MSQKTNLSLNEILGHLKMIRIIEQIIKSKIRFGLGIGIDTHFGIGPRRVSDNLKIDPRHLGESPGELDKPWDII